MKNIKIFVSIIIPVYNGEKVIKNNLNSLLNQKFNEIKVNYEIIIVNDGSTDDTEKIVKTYIEKHKNIKLINQENQGPAAARNNGVRNAKGEIILFTDADCIPENNWIEEMIKPFLNDKNIIGVKGIYKTEQTKPVAQFVQYEYEYKYKKMMKFKTIDFIDTYSAGYKKSTFLKYEGYNTNFPVACAEDVELSFRMKKDNLKMIFNPNAAVKHIHPDSIKSYFNKKLKFAYWRMATVKMHPNIVLNDSHTPQTMEMQIIFLFLSILFLILSCTFTSFIFISIFFILLYLLVSFKFYFFIIKKNRKLFLLAFVLIIIRSFAQGLGILLRIKDNLLKKNLIK